MTYFQTHIDELRVVPQRAERDPALDLDVSEVIEMCNFEEDI